MFIQKQSFPENVAIAFDARIQLNGEMKVKCKSNVTLECEIATLVQNKFDKKGKEIVKSPYFVD